TPPAGTDQSASLSIRHFWEQLGSRVVEMTPEDHDVALATTSHLPHVVASALAATLPEKFFPLTASGFRDTTRIAAGDSDLWVAILLENAPAVSASLAAFSEPFRKFQEAIENRDAGELKKLLQLAKRNRDGL
ncbi:MAG: prephenate dehydrogenase, partial [Rhodopirellula sp.]|nr:prephenate dehydrogenase [Rhodopirellula sp.]